MQKKYAKEAAEIYTFLTRFGFINVGCLANRPTIGAAPLVVRFIPSTSPAHILWQSLSMRLTISVVLKANSIRMESHPTASTLL